MARLRPLLALLALLLAPLAWASVAPDFTLRDVNSKSYALADLRAKNKVVLVNFWATWCGPCQVEMPHLQAMYAELASKGLAVVGISIDDARSSSMVKPLVSSKKLTYPVLLDTQSSVVALYNPAKTLPYNALIGSDGSLLYSHAGYNPGDEVTLKSKVLEALGTP